MANAARDYPSDMEAFERAREYYRENSDKILAEFEDKYIAIIEDEVVDSDEDFSELAERVYGTYGYHVIYMPFVTKNPKPLWVRSPRIIR